MANEERQLPFPRGDTAEGGSGVTLSDTMWKKLEGRIVAVNDTIHGTGQKVLLRIVKNDSGAAITSARKFYKFATTDALDFGRRIADVNDSAGGVCKPMDDAYVVGTSIADDDLFYVVEAGPCYVNTEASSVSLSAGGAVVSDASGLVDGAAPAAGNYICGRIDADCTTTSTAVVIHVEAGLVGGEGT